MSNFLENSSNADGGKSSFLFSCKEATEMSSEKGASTGGSRAARVCDKDSKCES